jgi:hypothetical protein
MGAWKDFKGSTTHHAPSRFFELSLGAQLSCFDNRGIKWGDEWVSENA